MAKVRLTIRPDEECEIPDDEIPGLRAQGLLAGDGSAPAAATAPAETGPARPKIKPSDQQGA